MRSKWRRVEDAGDANSPVEMRFIDMFMTAIGSLVFIAILLIRLLPSLSVSIPQQATPKPQSDAQEQPPPPQQAMPKPKSEAEEQPPPAPPTPQETASMFKLPPSGGMNTESTEVLRRWHSVQVVIHKCRDVGFVLYVRNEAPKLIDIMTGKEVPPARPFNASDPADRTLLFGDRYRDAGPEQLGVEVDSAGTQIIAFYGVSRGLSTHSVYLGIRDPMPLGSRECVIYPQFQTWDGTTSGRRIVMSRARPFAWLRRFEIGREGQITFTSAPDTEDGFRKKLVAFSTEQSQLLCERSRLCGTEDAHLHAIRSAGAAPGLPTAKSFLRFPGKRFSYRPTGPQPEVAESIEECEGRCDRLATCVSYTYFKKSAKASSMMCRLMEDGGRTLIDDPGADSGAKDDRSGAAKFMLPGR